MFEAHGDDAWAGRDPEDQILFLDDASVELIEDEPSGGTSLDTAVTRVWIRPYAAR